MEKAFTKFFRDKKGFPKFKCKHKSKQVVGFPQNTKVDFDHNKVSIGKIGWIKARLSRSFEGNIKTSTIEKTASGKYFISITVELPDIKVKQKPIAKETAVGIDTGIKTFAVFSDGNEIENPKHLKASLKRLKVLQKRVSKKVKGSNNRKKAVKKLAIIHEHIASQRLDFLHKQTTSIVKKYDTVVCENLNIAGMVKNHKLAQSIADLGLGRFYTLLQYKMNEKGGNYLEIGRFEPSSRMCSCGVINKDLTLKDREWTCKTCNTTHNRDLLAANNILKFGLQKHRHAKAYKKIEKGLLENPKMLLEKQKAFEAQFGKDQLTRSKRQWNNLVRVYGIEIVCEKENMTKDQVKQRCNETYSQRLKRTMRAV